MSERVAVQRYRWVILLLSSLGFTMSWIFRSSYSPLIEEIKASLGLSYSEAGLLMSLFWIGYNLTQIPSGIISDKIGVRVTYSLALLIAGLFNFLRGSAASFLELALYTFINGLACGFSWAPGSLIIIRWFKLKERSMALGIFTSSAPIGIVTALFSAPLISTVFGSWRWSFWILSLPTFIVSTLMFIFLKDNPPTTRYKENDDEGNIPVTEILLTIVKSKNFWLFTIVMIGLTTITSGAMTWVPSYYINIFSLSPVVAGSLVAISSAVSIFSGPSAGFLATHLLKRKTPIMFLSVFVTSILYLLLSLRVDFNLTLNLILIIIANYFGNMGFGINVSILADWFPLSIVGTAAGFLNFTGGMGSVIGPWLFGEVLEVTGSYAYSWATLALIALAASSLMIPIMRKEKSAIEEI